jgi:hypothetical protein
MCLNKVPRDLCKETIENLVPGIDDVKVKLEASSKNGRDKTSRRRENSALTWGGRKADDDDDGGDHDNDDNNNDDSTRNPTGRGFHWISFIDRPARPFLDKPATPKLSRSDRTKQGSEP